MTGSRSDMRTPLARVRGLGASHSGSRHFWYQRLTAVAGISLSIAFIVIVMMVLGRSHAAAVQILGSPAVVILLLLFVINVTYHMWLGMQVIIEDYVHHEGGKIALLMGNTFICFAIGLVCAYALLKLSFGV
jgi:succinate dehydrogenase / fumarate reductase membrane anchor subunit